METLEKELREAGYDVEGIKADAIAQGEDVREVYEEILMYEEHNSE